MDHADTAAELDNEFRVGQAQLVREERREKPADRHRRLRSVRDRVKAWWTYLRRYRAVRFIGAFAILYTHRRAFGFSAEAAFWATFTLPWLVLGGVSAISLLAGKEAMTQIQEKILEAAESVLTADAVDSVVEPLLNEVVRGSAGLTVVGLLVALWSGSRVFASLVEGSAMLNGSPKRTYFKTRGLALAIYLMGLSGLALLVLSIARWPDALSQGLESVPGGTSAAIALVALAAGAGLSTTMMWLANPRRRKWWYALPGGILSLLLWLLGSWGLSIYLSWLLREGTLYGAIAAPIAVMLWIFVTTLAQFIGITLNATILLFRDVLGKRAHHLKHREQSAVDATGKVISMAEYPEQVPDSGSWRSPSETARSDHELTQFREVYEERSTTED